MQDVQLRRFRQRGWRAIGDVARIQQRHIEALAVERDHRRVPRQAAPEHLQDRRLLAVVAGEELLKVQLAVGVPVDAGGADEPAAERVAAVRDLDADDVAGVGAVDSALDALADLC